MLKKKRSSAYQTKSTFLRGKSPSYLCKMGFRRMLTPTMDTPPCASLLPSLQKLRNPKLIRSFASDAELEDALIKAAERTGYSMSEIIRQALRSSLLQQGS